MRKPECGIIKDCGSRKSEVGIKNKVDMRFKFHFPSSRHTNFTNFVSVEIRENLCPNFLVFQKSFAGYRDRVWAINSAVLTVCNR